MQVTGVHVQLLHDFLADDPDAVSRAHEQERRQPGSLNELGTLVEAAFGISARRVFAPSWSMPEVIQFVARARVETAGGHTPFSALDAERVLRRAFGDQVPSPRSHEAAGAAMMCMLHVLVADLKLDDAGLSDLLEQARAAADESLDQKAPRQSGTGAADTPGPPRIGTGAEIRQQNHASAEAGLDQDSAEPRWLVFAQRMLETFQEDDTERRIDIDQLRAENQVLVARVDVLEARFEQAQAQIRDLKTKLESAAGSGSDGGASR